MLILLVDHIEAGDTALVLSSWAYQPNGAPKSHTVEVLPGVCTLLCVLTLLHTNIFTPANKQGPKFACSGILRHGKLLPGLILNMMLQAGSCSKRLEEQASAIMNVLKIFPLPADLKSAQSMAPTPPAASLEGLPPDGKQTPRKVSSLVCSS